MKYSTIIYEKKDRIARITLNRPDSLNAINTALREDFRNAVDEIRLDEEVDVLILSGAGRAFCAGMDLKELSEPKAEPSEPTVPIPDPSDQLRKLSIPIICAVHKYALTGGLELVMACDIIVAAEDTQFGDTHSRVGVHPGGGMSQMLPRLVGLNKAKELSFTGNFISAQEALQWGLVNRVVPADELQSVVEATAQDILSSNQKLVRRMKNLIDAAVATPIETGLAMEKRSQGHFHESQGSDIMVEEETKEKVLKRGRTQSEKE